MPGRNWGVVRCPLMRFVLGIGRVSLFDPEVNRALEASIAYLVRSCTCAGVPAILDPFIQALAEPMVKVAEVLPDWGVAAAVGWSPSNFRGTGYLPQ